MQCEGVKRVGDYKMDMLLLCISYFFFAAIDEVRRLFFLLRFDRAVFILLLIDVKLCCLVPISAATFTSTNEHAVGLRFFDTYLFFTRVQGYCIVWMVSQKSVVKIEYFSWEIVRENREMIDIIAYILFLVSMM